MGDAWNLRMATSAAAQPGQEDETAIKVTHSSFQALVQERGDEVGFSLGW